jgi:dephospho-CoA kinase
VFRVGLTGGIASGKTTVAALFAELGAGVVDTDEIAREVVASGSPGLNAVIAAFGPELLLDSGELDRSAMRTLVFSDSTARQKLESIVHPLIRARTLDRVEALDTPYAIIVVPLLVETDFATLVDRVLVVDCPREVQLERLVERDRVSVDEAKAAVAAQADREIRTAQADDIIDSGEPLTRTRERVATLHEEYLRHSMEHADQN